jgi:hypothetical protein
MQRNFLSITFVSAFVDSDSTFVAWAQRIQSVARWDSMLAPPPANDRCRPLWLARRRYTNIDCICRRFHSRPPLLDSTSGFVDPLSQPVGGLFSYAFTSVINTFILFAVYTVFHEKQNKSSLFFCFICKVTEFSHHS